MDSIGRLLKERLEQIIIENEMFKKGFAAVPYEVLLDTRLDVEARLAYAILLRYAWQEGSCFPGQQRMALDMGISTRHLRRALTELRNVGYISWKKLLPGGTNTYTIHDVGSKLSTMAKRTPASSQWGHGRPINGDARVR
jgi:hypothetical protein